MKSSMKSTGIENKPVLNCWKVGCKN